MSFYAWKRYIPVAQRRKKAERVATESSKAGFDLSPVKSSRGAIARTFWGKAWCDNLERYSDFANRLPRGRTYLRNGSVIDLKITSGEVRAKVIGSRLYDVNVTVSPVPRGRWQSISGDCAGSIDSLVELLQGRLSKAVMERICRPGTGLFPLPKEIRFGCSCPDWASMCKHVAAVLYGVGARLDSQPELIFALRRADPKDLVAQAGVGLRSPTRSPHAGKVLDDAHLADVFDIELADVASVGSPAAGRHASTTTKTKKAPANVGVGVAVDAARKPTAIEKTRPAKSQAARKATMAKVPSKSPARSPAPANSKGKEALRDRNSRMPTRKPAKKSSNAQHRIGKARLAAMIEEATADAHGESEQTTGWYSRLEEHLALPFDTTLLDVAVKVVGLDLRGEIDIVAICTRGRQRQAVRILDLPLPSPAPEGAEWIEAYRRWIK